MGAMTLFSENVEHVAECGGSGASRILSERAFARYMSVPSASAASCLIDGEAVC
jgi:hypothetical protein